MRQAVTTMFWRLLGRESAGESSLLLSSGDVDGDEIQVNKTSSSGLLARFWQLCGEAIIRRLRGGAPKPKPPQDYNAGPHCIVDVKMDGEIDSPVLPVVEPPKGSGKPPSEPASGYHLNYNALSHSNINHQYSIVEIEEPISSQSTDDVIERVVVSPVVEERRPGPPLVSSSINIGKSRGSLGPYSWEQKILVVGDGDFSFSASLAVAFGDASNMTATSLNSLKFLKKNYAKAVTNISELTSRSCKVMHGVDATEMARHPQLHSRKFDRVIYNFPHAGFANRSDPPDAQIIKHQDLVRGFLKNAKKMIKDDGQIHITHKCVGFFLDWNIEMLGESQGLRLVEESPFNSKLYPGYSPKYGYGGDEMSFQGSAPNARVRSHTAKKYELIKPVQESFGNLTKETKDNKIVWPPMVLVMNTLFQKGDDGKVYNHSESVVCN